MMKINFAAKKMIVYVIIFLHCLQGCAIQSGQNTAIKVGPKSSSSYSELKAANPVLAGPKLDVIIPIFDPGLSGDAENYEEEGVWPELRRAEANRFAYKLKQALDNSHAFGAVRVTPDSTASGDLYILGKIVASDGQEVEIELNVVDISGQKWLEESFEYEVQEAFYKNTRNKGKDAYEPVFKQATDEIIEALKDHSASELDDLKYLANLQFGASFNDEAFSEYTNSDDGKIKLVSKPSDQDPLLQRVMAIRVREQLFVDNLQQNYVAFSQNMDDSYLVWQAASFTEMKLQGEAKRVGIYKTIGGVLLIALAVAAGLSGSNVVASTAAIAGGIGGATMISGGFQSIEEAKFHKEALNELSESINLEMSPQVINFENESVKLTGNIQQQFSQWRTFLKRIYEQESTPDIEL